VNPAIQVGLSTVIGIVGMTLVVGTFDEIHNCRNMAWEMVFWILTVLLIADTVSGIVLVWE
jgi:hypothetical protein